MAACMRHHSSHHVAHQLPTSPCIHFPTHAAASPQGLGGFAALYPNCGKQKNLLLVYDMHHNFASFFSSILQVSEPKNAKTLGSLEQRRAEAARRRGNGTFLRRWASFQAKQPTRSISWGRL